MTFFGKCSFLSSLLRKKRSWQRKRDKGLALYDLLHSELKDFVQERSFTLRYPHNEGLELLFHKTGATWEVLRMRPKDGYLAFDYGWGMRETKHARSVRAARALLAHMVWESQCRFGSKYLDAL